jgi:Uma2 family endonuclease
MHQKSAPLRIRRDETEEADEGTPTWEVAHLFPVQSTWTEADYLALDRVHDGFPLVELSGGRLEVLPWPTQTHQLVLAFLFEKLAAFTQAHAPGVVLISGMRVRLGKGKYRAPDILYMKAANARCRHEDHWDGADLVMEIVSPDPKDHDRDWKAKPREYARAGVAEYWIVAPRERIVRVLTLHGKSYRVHGDFSPDARATSVLLPGFAVSVAELLAAGRESAG